MTKSLIASLMIVATVLTLSGCGQSDTDTNDSRTASGTTNDGSQSDMFAIDACNDYVTIMNCMVNQSPAEAKEGSQKMLQTVLDSWKQLSPDQLKTACDATMTVMTKQEDAIKAMGCEVK